MILHFCTCSAGYEMSVQVFRTNVTSGQTEQMRAIPLAIDGDVFYASCGSARRSSDGALLAVVAGGFDGFTGIALDETYVYDVAEV